MALRKVLEILETDEKASVSKFLVATDSKIFVSTHEDNSECTIWFFDLHISQQPYALRSHSHVACSLAGDGEYLLSGAHDKLVLWDLIQKQPIQSFFCPPATANAVLIWDISTIVSAHYDKLIRVWGRSTATCRTTLEGHTYRGGVRHLARYQDYLLSAAESIRMWDVKQGTCVRVFELQATSISKMIVSESILAASCHDRKSTAMGAGEWVGSALYLSIGPLANQSSDISGVLEGHDAVLGHIKIDGDYVATGAADGSIGIWSRSNLGLTHFISAPEFEGPRCSAYGCIRGVVGFDFEGGVLLASGWNGVTKIASIEQLPSLRDLGPSLRVIWGVKLCNREAYVVLTSGKVCLEIWDLELGLNANNGSTSNAVRRNEQSGHF